MMQNSRSAFLLVLLVLSGVGLLAPVTASSQSIPQKGDAAMRRVFGAAVELTTTSVYITAEATKIVKAKTGQLVRGSLILRIAKSGDRILGYGVIDDVRGKSQPITYMTLLKPDGTIADLEVLAYREPYGGEVQYETFRKQFRGKSSKSDLRVSHDIQNVAGATISSHAVTDGAKKIVEVFAELKRENKF